MNNDISWLNLTLGYALLLIPVFILYYYKTSLVKPLLISFLRMTVQLAFVGFYLTFIFKLDKWWLNLLWVIVMTVIAGFTVIKRSDVKIRYFLIPVLMGISFGVVLTTLVFLIIVRGGDNFWTAQLVIPVTGMIIGNCLSSCIIGIRTFYHTLNKELDKYKYCLMCGATKSEAIFPFIGEALKMAFSPSIASIATIGLIWIPGLMTGQILGGSIPLSAIKYQILIMIAIITGGILTVILTINVSKKIVFDDFDMLSKEAFK